MNETPSTPSLTLRVASMPWAFTQQHPLDTAEFIAEAGKRGVRLDPLALREVYRVSLLAPFVTVTSAASGNVCPGDDAAESLVVGVVVAPDDVPADHAGLLFVAGVVGAVECEVPQGVELGFYAV
jgi:hypothetical protein